VHGIVSSERGVWRKGDGSSKGMQGGEGEGSEIGGGKEVREHGMGGGHVWVGGKKGNNCGG